MTFPAIVEVFVTIESIPKEPIDLERRRLLVMGAAAATSVVAAPAIIRSAKAADRQIVVSDPGGPFTKGWGEAYYKPFTEATGIKVISVASPAERNAEVRTMVETKTYSWDMVGAMAEASIAMLAAGGYIEQHNLDNDPVVRQIPAEFRTPYGIGSDVYATAIGYRTDRVPTDKAPRSWADLWNVRAYPGRRGLRRHPFDLIEEALLADGVPPAQLYPCDLDRAFRALDRIKPQISAWFTSGAQATQMLTSDEVDLLPVWTTRIMAARAAGAPVDIEWKDNLWALDLWAILKGTPKADLCREFIRFTCDAKRQAVWTKYVRNGPVHPTAYDYIDKEIASTLPTFPANKAKGIKIDVAYWSANKDVALNRFNAWVLGD